MTKKNLLPNQPDLNIFYQCLYFSQECHTSLLRSCWHELFLLGLAQCFNVMKLDHFFTAIIKHLQSTVKNGEGNQCDNVCASISKK